MRLEETARGRKCDGFILLVPEGSKINWSSFSPLKTLTNNFSAMFRPYFVCAVFGVIGFSAHAGGNSLCSTQEKSIWSCSSKHKLYELCASQDLGKSTGYLQYRAGRIGKIELAYPPRPIHPQGLFRHRLYARNAALIFRNGRYEYEPFDALVGGSELRVQVDGKTSRNIICEERNETFTDTAIINLFREIGINDQ